MSTELDAIGLLAKVDRAVLTLYCEWWATERELKAKLAVEPITVAGSMGQQVANPAWAMHRDASDRVERLAKELLCTPVARLRATLPEEPDDQDDGGILD